VTELNIDATIARLNAGHLEAVLSKPRKGDPTGALIVPITAEHVNTLVRACLTAAPGNTLSVWDFSQVEARKLAWAAQDHDALARFALYDSGDKVNGDPYRAMAAKIYGGGPGDYSKESPQRKVGKAAELACGYSQGGGGLVCPYPGKDYGKPYGFCGYVIKEGGNWAEIIESMGLGGDVDEAGAAAVIVEAWRELHHPIVCFWRELQDAAVEVTQGQPGISCPVGPFTWHNIDGLICCELPSGRLLCYRGMRCDFEESKFGGRPRASLSYLGRKGRERTYGGKLTENVIQASCRDLMAEALIKAEECGLNPSHTIHDEILCDVPAEFAADADALMGEIMTMCPAWCEGMPLAAEGLPLSFRYGK
jgi:DNA polymerase